MSATHHLIPCQDEACCYQVPYWRTWFLHIARPAVWMGLHCLWAYWRSCPTWHAYSIKKVCHPHTLCGCKLVPWPQTSLLDGLSLASCTSPTSLLLIGTPISRQLWRQLLSTVQSSLLSTSVWINPFISKTPCIIWECLSTSKLTCLGITSQWLIVLQSHMPSSTSAIIPYIFIK